MWTPNSMRILYKTSILTESYAFLKSIKSWCTASLYSHFFSSMWRIQNIWPAVELSRRNPHWWSPIISSAYGLNFDSSLLDILAHELQSAVVLAVGCSTFIMNCNKFVIYVYQIVRLNIKLKQHKINSNFSFSITNHKSRFFKQLHSDRRSSSDEHSRELFFSHNDRYCHLQKYWPFHWITLYVTSWSRNEQDIQ